MSTADDVAKQNAAGICGPGYRLAGRQMRSGLCVRPRSKTVADWRLEAIAKGCPPGMGWNAQEGCHEDD